jgi:xanthine dehydrogenase accessory factor
MLVLIKGAGDLASGVAVRLHRAGMKIIMTDIPQPTVIRRTVSFAQAVYDGETKVEDITGKKAENVKEALAVIAEGKIPVIVDPACQILNELKFDAVVDAILAKKNINTKITDGPIVVALGPGFTAGIDCHAVIETQRGHDLARVLLTGQPAPDTGIPGMIGGYAKERVIKSPATGSFVTTGKIGDIVAAGDSIGYIETADNRQVPVTTEIPGVLRGILYDRLPVFTGMKIGDVDPRPVYEHCFSCSDKARAIGGGVLEAILHFASAAKADFYNC